MKGLGLPSQGVCDLALGAKTPACDGGLLPTALMLGASQS